MNKTVLGIIVVIAVLAVGWFFYMQKVQTESPSQNQTENIEAETGTGAEVSLEGDMIDDIIVTYTNEGFEPSTVTINRSQTVRFVNQSSRGMWVGSDQHPTHTQYPEKSEADCLGSSFDTCKSLPANESWSFTFNSVGSWGFHNHVQAAHKGTIVVQ